MNIHTNQMADRLAASHHGDLLRRRAGQRPASTGRTTTPTSLVRTGARRRRLAFAAAGVGLSAAVTVGVAVAAAPAPVDTPVVGAPTAQLAAGDATPSDHIVFGRFLRAV